MSPTQAFLIQLLQEGREYLKMIVPVVLAWHLPNPGYMHKPPTEKP